MGGFAASSLALGDNPQARGGVIRTRFAPSPNGQLHLGHAYAAIVAHARTAFGRTAIGVANPCMVKPMGYAPNADWQCGWTVLLLRPPTFDWATPYVVICDDDGGACWGDRYYSGRP